MRILLLAAALASVALAQERAPSPASKPAVAPPVGGLRIALERASGEREVRDLAGFETNDPRALGVALIRFDGGHVLPSRGAAENEAVLELTNGDHLNGRVRGGRAELLDVEVVGGVHVGVAIDELTSIVFPERIPDTWTGALVAPEEGDILYRRTQEGLDPDKGGVEEFTTDGVRFHGQVGTRLVPWSDVAALFVEGFEEEAEPATDTDGARVVVDLVDRSRLRGRLEKIDAQGVRIATHNGEKLLLPAAVVANVLVDDGKLVYLSAIEPAEAIDSAPFGDDLGMRWPHRVDRSVTGGPLVAAGRISLRGLGVHAPSRLAWKLDRTARSLRGSVAVDDQTLRLAARGSVRFRVLLDGKVAWESPVVRGGDAPIAIPPIALEEARELALEVDDAGDGHAGDRADWLDLLLVR